MIAGYLKFNSLPEIGFAHNYYSDKYVYHYGKSKCNFEIAYINSGGISAEYMGKKIYADEGSIFILFRHLPITISASGNKHQSHCTIQLGLDFDFELADTDNTYPDEGLLLPFVTPPQPGTDEIKKELYDIVNQISSAPGRYSFNASLRILGILEKLDRIARTTSKPVSRAHLDIAAAVSYYIETNIGRKITLSDLAKALDKSPNYINYAFKCARGTSITEYINEEKIRWICILMQKGGMPFHAACEAAGIQDISYGYRLFKKHIGLTPSVFLKSERIIKKDIL